MWYIHTMEYYPTTKKMLFKYAVIWMNSENIMPSERIQSQQTTYYVIPYTEKSRIKKTIETESRLVIA